MPLNQRKTDVFCHKLVINGLNSMKLMLNMYHHYTLVLLQFLSRRRREARHMYCFSGVIIVVGGGGGGSSGVNFFVFRSFSRKL